MHSIGATILPELIEKLAEAKRVVVLTGAGVSAESGVPTFRGAQTGVWAQFKPEELATPEAFRRNPRRVWEWYAWRREQLRRILPNPAHVAIAELEGLYSKFTLVTQNVDGLHQLAGSQNAIELHGNITHTKCFAEETRVELPAESDEIPPRCPDCGSYLRPDVVWFGEALPEEALTTALAECTASDILLSIGTSGLVYPAATLPYSAAESGATIVEINPQPSLLADSADFVLRHAAGAILPKLVKELKMFLGKRE